MIEDIGLLPYSERLDILGLMTLALVEHHTKGDLIEVYKAKHGFSLSSDVFRFSRSGLNLLSKFGHTVVSHIYAYDRAKTLSFILLIRRKSTEFENESNV